MATAAEAALSTTSDRHPTASLLFQAKPFADSVDMNGNKQSKQYWFQSIHIQNQPTNDNKLVRILLSPPEREEANLDGTRASIIVVVGSQYRQSIPVLVG